MNLSRCHIDREWVGTGVHEYWWIGVDNDSGIGVKILYIQNIAVNMLLLNSYLIT